MMTVNKSQKTGLKDKIQIATLMYLSVWVSSPFFAYGNIYRLIALLAILTWILVEFTQPKNIFLRPTSYLIVLMVFLIYTIPISYMSDGLSGLNRNIQFYIMLFFLFVYAAYQRRSFSYLKPVIYLNIILFTVWCITTYQGLLLDPHASRYIVKSNEIARSLTKSGVGGFAFVYSLLVYIVLMMALLKNKNFKSIFPRLFIFAATILAIIVVLKAGYSTAVLLMVLSITFFLFYSRSIQKNIILFFFLLILFIVLKFYILDILHYLYSHVQQGAYRLKLQDLIDSYQLGEATGTTEDRVERYWRSFNIFLEHPLVGIWSIQSVGKHSLVLDTFAQYGLLLGSALLYILLKVPYQLYKKSTKQKPLTLTMLFLITTLIGLNNVAMVYGFMFYVFYPYILEELEASSQ